MLATRWPKIFDDPDWWFEIKWDGYRIVLSTVDGVMRARSRGGIDLLEVFPELRSLQIPANLILDGEVVVFDSDGKPSFSMLQRRSGFPSDEPVTASLVAFDLLYDGVPLFDKPYHTRIEILARKDLPGDGVVGEPIHGSGSAVYAAVSQQGLEGVVAKRGASIYRPGRRSPDWRKISIRHTLRAVVGGFTMGEGSRAGTFGSLAVGLYDDDGLRCIGTVGSGFDEPTLRAFRDALDELVVDTSPFSNDVAANAKVRWVEPGLVVVVEFKEWTRDFRLRAPVFKGIDATAAGDVTWAVEGPS